MGGWHASRGLWPPGVAGDRPAAGPSCPSASPDGDTSPSGPAPLPGQHKRWIAASLGYGEAQIDALVADGVLYAEADVARLLKDAP